MHRTCGLATFSVSRRSCSRRFKSSSSSGSPQGDLPHCSDAASDSGLGRAANRGMLRLGSSATAILDSRSRQPLWRELRWSRAGSRNTASSYAVQVAPSLCDPNVWTISLFSTKPICVEFYPLTSPITVVYYNRWRPHRSLGQAVPCGEARPLPRQACRKIVAEPVLGGLHHVYRAAA
jgi:hypothetical protein